MAEYEHARWNVERLLEGWKYSTEKDVANKKSPSLIPWRDLTEGVKRWDRDAVRNVPLLLSKINYEIYK
jgi:hypothetical protein